MQAVPLRLSQRLINWLYGISPQTVLNAGISSSISSDTAGAVDAGLKASMNHLKAVAFSTHDGQTRVDYATLRDSEAYQAYRDCARRLTTFDPAQLATHEERLAFWINVYNALLIDAVIACQIQRSVRDVPDFFWRAAYSINGYRFSTMDIEQGILRANAGHPAIPGPHFAPNDPRRTYVIETPDPRVHFALVCASHSCPPVGVYAAQHIEEQLALATRSFINGGGVIAGPKTNAVHLSRIFQWYASDFGGSPFGDRQSILDYVTPHVADAPTRDWLTTNRNTIRVRYQKYDWSLNGSNAA